MNAELTRIIRYYGVSAGMTIDYIYFTFIINYFYNTQGAELYCKP
jgi:hypothetical protein